MADTQILTQLKFRIASLESTLAEKQKAIDEYRSVQDAAQSKIKGLQKIHAQKVKSLLNSIQILKKEKASIQGLSKEHKRSKLIQQLNKEILDQDTVIDILRKHIYEKEGKEKGRQQCDDIIVKALKKGPQRIRPLTREQLRIEIDKLKEINIKLEKKLKEGGKKGRQILGGLTGQEDSISEVSSLSESRQTIQGHNPTEQLLHRLKSLQLQLQNTSLQLNSKNKIIQKLKISLKESEKYKSENQLLKNQLQLANRKVITYEKLLKENKEKTNKKLIDLYERQLKVEELEMMGKDKEDRLKSAHETHNVLLQELQAEKEQLQAEFDQLKQENQRILLDNISNKKHQQSQKAKIDEIRQINQKQKTQLSEKLKEYEQQVQRILQENQKLKTAYHNIESKLFAQRAQWVEIKQKYIQEIQQLRVNKAEAEKNANLLIEIDSLLEKNRQLEKILEGGNMTADGSGNKILFERLENYKRKIQYYEGLLSGKPMDKEAISAYNDLFQKYNKLSEQFLAYRQGSKKQNEKGKKTRKAIVQLDKKEKQQYEGLSSGIDSLNLGEVDSEILDNFDTSYEYSIRVNQFGDEVKVPKITQADKELLKLINSDLWYFVKDDQLTRKIEEASDLENSQEIQQKRYVADKVRKLRNISHPQGQKVTLYEEELRQMEELSENVSITSAMEKQMKNFDSDVNIQMKKGVDGAPHTINLRKTRNMSLDIGSDVPVSSVESGDSNIRRKRKPVQKASKLKFTGLGGSVDSLGSELSSQMLNSDVSSVGISDRQLNRIDSDVQVDFRKKKRN